MSPNQYTIKKYYVPLRVYSPFVPPSIKYQLSIETTFHRNVLSFPSPRLYCTRAR